MLFNSFEFIFIFLPITFFLYFYVNSKGLITLSKSFLVLASLFFYSFWNLIYLPLIIGSMLFNYAVGYSINKKQDKNTKKLFLIFGILSNLVLLGYFKYADFFIENVNYFTSSNIPTLNIVLPLAISFFTFQQIAYLVDSYQKNISEYNFINYALFVSFFPQLIAGPIVHYKQMMPQFTSKWTKIKNYRNIALGIVIFSIGLFKKVVIADSFSKWANYGFNTNESLNLIEGWATSLSYTFQLYFDFSGYTDMAIGIALLFNIRLPINFNSPYKATNIQDFWRRWHITLSNFLRDYIYIPLGGNKKSSVKTYNNIMVTFLLGGLWHGAAWTFVFWGFLHAFALIVHRTWRSLGYKMNSLLAWFITFNFINISWVFFRAEEWSDAVRVLSAMIGLNSIGSFRGLFTFVYVDTFTFGFILFAYFIACIGFFFNTTVNVSYYIVRQRWNWFFIAAILWISILHLNKVNEFLYFNF